MRWIVLLLVLSIAGCGGGADERDAPVVAIPDGFVEQTDAYLRRLEKLGFSGGVLVASRGGPILNQGYGLADRANGRRFEPRTISTIGSITKQFTGAAILRLQERGRLSVDDSIADYFPDVPDDKRSITLHQLLTHSSGIDDLDGVGDWDPVEREEFVRRTLAQPLVFEPGEEYRYSNAGYSLLGAIVEQLTGDSYERFLRDEFFEAAGMEDTGYVLPEWEEARIAVGYEGDERWGTVLERPFADDGPYWALRANGGIHSTSLDMLRWAQALLAGEVLSEESLTEYWTPHVDEGGGDSFYGYGWVVLDFPGGQPVITHNGGNGIFFADMAIFPEDGTVFFIQSNVVADWPMTQILLERMGLRWFEGEAYPSVPDLVPMGPAELERWAGEYRLESGAVDVRATPGRLEVWPRDPFAYGVLHSARPFERRRAERLSGRIDAIVGAYIEGDFGPLHAAYGGDTPVERLREGWGEYLAAGESQHGTLRGHEILGAAMGERWDITVVRMQFDRGHDDMMYVWDPDQDERLIGRSRRGVPLAVEYIPTGDDRFGSWDGGRSASRELFFKEGDNAVRVMTLATAEGAVRGESRIQEE